MIIKARHYGSGRLASAGRTAGASQKSLAFISDGTDKLLLVFPDPVDIVSLNPTTTTGTAGFASDPIVGIILPSLTGELEGEANGIISFVPASSGARNQSTVTGEFSFAAGDSFVQGTWDRLEIDLSTGEAQIRFPEFHYSEAWDEIGIDGVATNPSSFLGEFVDEHLLDSNDTTTAGVMFRFDATTLLNGSMVGTNYFQKNSFDNAAFTLTGAALVPEPAAQIFDISSSDGTISFGASVTPGIPYALQASTNVMDPAAWELILTNTPATNILLHIESGNFPARFYRLVPNP